MKNPNQIFTIAFEGESRSGKDTQIELIKSRLSEMKIPCIAIRGEGYRNGLGDVGGDPESDYWKKMSKVLRENPGEYKLWNDASYRLARELIVWRDRILSKNVEESLKPFGILLVDRSLMSNAILKTLESKPESDYQFTPEELYPESIQNRKKISADMVLPDMIIEFIAPKEVLLKRLDKNNPDYKFKKESIEDKYELYLNAKKSLPKEIQDIIVSINSSGSQEEVFSEVLENIKSKFPELEISLK